MPSNREGNDVVKCRVSGYKPRVFGIPHDNYMARTRRGPLPEKLQYAPRVRSARPDRLTGIRGCIELAGARRGHSLVGMTVVDPEGIEVGYVSGEETNVLVLGEGSGGRMRLGRRYVSGVADRITLSGPVAQIFTGLNVVDSDGEFVGIVRDTNEADDVLDSFIVEDEQGEMMNVLLEDVRSIDEWVELSVAGDSLYEKG